MSELSVGTLSGLAANSYVVDVASGSQLTQPGMILQVVQATKGDTFSTNSEAWVSITDLAVTITPSSASSKFLLTYSIPGVKLSADRDAHFRLSRNGTAVGLADSTFGSAGFVRQLSPNSATFTQTFLDSPATASALTYQAQTRVAASDATATLADNNRGLMSITVLEVAA